MKLRTLSMLLDIYFGTFTLLATSGFVCQLLTKPDILAKPDVYTYFIILCSLLFFFITGAYVMRIAHRSMLIEEEEIVKKNKLMDKE